MTYRANASRNVSFVRGTCGLFGLLGLWLATTCPAIPAADKKSESTERAWSAELRVKRLFASHTSYEFGNPEPPFQAPLSRLEFPMNAWWAGGSVRRSFPRFSIGGEALRNASTESMGFFKDSDWTDEAQPGVRTIYSESRCRLAPSYMVRGDVDVKVSDWIQMPGWLDLRPVSGVRWQRLEFVAHDGIQVERDWPFPIPLPGDSIRFEQQYLQYFVGARAVGALGGLLKHPRLRVSGEFDWAHVRGDNRDHHLLREGTRLTFEKSSGNGWHGALGVSAELMKNLEVVVDGDFLAIRTTGSHRWFVREAGIDESWTNGVKVWSRQASLSIAARYAF